MYLYLHIQLTVEGQMSCYTLFFSESLRGHTRQSSSRWRMHWKSSMYTKLFKQRSTVEINVSIYFYKYAHQQKIWIEKRHLGA